MDEILNVNTQIQQIRDLITNPRKQHTLLKNNPLWLQLCSSLDAIEDTELAISAYLKDELTAENGAQYLVLYGVMQAFNLQQDAVRNLCSALGIQLESSDYPKLDEIKMIRHDSVGHPTKRNRRNDKRTSYHFISRISLSREGFQLISDYGEGKTESRAINIGELISNQKKNIADILNSVINKLEKEESEHKRMFRNEKLTSVFPTSLNYHLEKILEVGFQNGSEQAAFQETNLKVIKQIMQKLHESLNKRGIELDTYDIIKYIYDSLEYPISELEKYYQCIEDRKIPAINRQTAYIFAFFIREKINELRETIKTIDDEYSS